MIIRDAVETDWPQIWAIMRPILAGGETYSSDGTVSEHAGRAWWMGQPGFRTFVAVEGGEVFGTAESGPNRDGHGSHVGTASFMVAAAAAGRGVGRALGEHVIEQARGDGFRSIQFNAVVETNIRAVELWKSLGFTIVGTVPEAFYHHEHGYVGLHVMHRFL